jgi:hypothetical protein
MNLYMEQYKPLPRFRELAFCRTVVARGIAIQTQLSLGACTNRTLVPAVAVREDANP